MNMRTPLIALTLLISLSSSAFAMEKRETSLGAARIVNRQFTVTPKECLAKIIPAPQPRASWKCVFQDSTIPNGFVFNTAYVHNDAGRVPSGPNTTLLITIESHPNGGSLGFSDPDPAHGSTRMVPFEEVRNLLSSSPETKKSVFSGTYLVAP